jgi:hypothetical protein
MFGYAGVIANDNPVFDATVTYDRKAWGCLFLKAIDLYDIHSSYDFSLALLYKKIHVSENLTITPYAGFVIEQRERLIDHDSDGMIVIITSLKVSPKFTLEHCGRFSNTFFKTELFDWLNRLRVLYSHKHVDMTFSTWHNNNFFDESAYTTVGLSAAYARIKISDRAMLSTVLTGLKVAASDPEEESMRNRLVFTIAATIH